jgi:NAD(P)H dehydrogenase (quinone)
MAQLGLMTTALLLLGHADPQSFNTALADAYADGLSMGGARIERLALAELAFDPVLRAGHDEGQLLEPDLVRAREAIERARHLVWAFPTYWAAPPAIVRAFVDRLFLPGWAFRYREGSALPDGLLKGRSARVISTMDSPSWWYALAHHRSLHATMGTATLSFCGVAPVRFTTVHAVRTLDAKKRAGWLERLRAQGRSDARSLIAPALLPTAA